LDNFGPWTRWSWSGGPRDPFQGSRAATNQFTERGSHGLRRRRQMDAVGDEGHKWQILAGEQPMEDVVVAREEMRAAVAKMGETGKPRRTGVAEQFERRIAVAGGHEHASCG